ncbi:VOC family protein [Kineosporia babensis]|uniref:VOC domain-containing protein n=1 Tax=Kineosporia babensis TaxID=499548 RepID=A0A9X1NC82_9ACTN|nr:hypothetical protein [Kineosporia babensis]MCD5311174.1 hypothetical protein [Kineosporia babensis]
MTITGVGAVGSTLQLWVGDGSAGRAWYERLFGRAPDFRPENDDSFCEWIFVPGHWEVHVVEHPEPGRQQGRFRFGVEEIDRVRAELMDAGVDVSEVTTIERVVKYCDFADPWGNRLGLYQDLSRYPAS